MSLQTCLNKKEGSGELEPQSKKAKTWQLCTIPACATTILKAFQVAAEWVQAQIKVLHLLPHMHFLVGERGPDDDQTTLLGMIDTGAGLNIGRLGYHQSITKWYPKLVTQFAFLQDIPGIEPLQIRGIGAGD